MSPIVPGSSVPINSGSSSSSAQAADRNPATSRADIGKVALSVIIEQAKELAYFQTIRSWNPEKRALFMDLIEKKWGSESCYFIRPGSQGYVVTTVNSSSEIKNTQIQDINTFDIEGRAESLLSFDVLKYVQQSLIEKEVALQDSTNRKLNLINQAKELTYFQSIRKWSPDKNALFMAIIKEKCAPESCWFIRPGSGNSGYAITTLDLRNGITSLPIQDINAFNPENQAGSLLSFDVLKLAEQALIENEAHSRLSIQENTNAQSQEHQNSVNRASDLRSPAIEIVASVVGQLVTEYEGKDPKAIMQRNYESAQQLGGKISGEEEATLNELVGSLAKEDKQRNFVKLLGDLWVESESNKGVVKKPNLDPRTPVEPYFELFRKFLEGKSKPEKVSREFQEQFKAFLGDPRAPNERGPLEEKPVRAGWEKIHKAVLNYEKSQFIEQYRKIFKEWGIRFEKTNSKKRLPSCSATEFKAAQGGPSAVAIECTGRASEDGYSIDKVRLGSATGNLYAVYDGHGDGGEIGNYLKEHFHGTLEACYKAIPEGTLEFDSQVYIAIKAAVSVLNRSVASLVGGSTMTAVLLISGKVYSINLGDSSSLISLNGSTIRLTVPHSPDALPSLFNRRNCRGVADGILSVVDRKVPLNTLRVLTQNGGLLVSGSMGDSDAEDGFIRIPVIAQLPDDVLISGAKIFLLSDGVDTHVQANSLVSLVNELVAEGKSLSEAVEYASNRALKRSHLRSRTGCRDDFTLVVVDVPPTDGGSSSSSSSSS